MADLLLVDNDARILELTAWFLERRGHRVRVAPSYREARERLREAPPELLLADLELGTESGRVELPRLAAEGLLPPTLVVSGFLDSELDGELRRLPAVRGTLSKPYDMPALEARIQACLEAAPEVVAPPPAPAAGLREVELEPRPAPPPSLPEPDADGWVELGPRTAPDRPQEGIR